MSPLHLARRGRLRGLFNVNVKPARNGSFVTDADGRKTYKVFMELSVRQALFGVCEAA